MTCKTILFVGAWALALVSAPAIANAQAYQWDSGPGWGWSVYDMNLNFEQDGDGTLTNGRRYVQLQGTNHGFAHCIEIETKGTDTVLWVLENGSSGDEVILSDDDGAGLGSKARLWTTAGAYVFKISHFYLSQSSDDFLLSIRRVYTNEAGCTANQNLPWIKVTGHGQATVFN